MSNQVARTARTAGNVAVGGVKFFGRRVLPPLVALYLLRKRALIGLQTMIAKGRKKYKRAALEENYAPVDKQVFQDDLQVVAGAIPRELDGVYMRNGSNPMFPVHASYHWFEGDGMIHAVKLSDGKASYCNHYVTTSRLQQEKKAGKAIFAKFGDQEGVRGLFVVLLELLKAKLGVIDMSRGNGTANTSIVYHAGRILALHEGDLPYQVRMLCSGVLETIGRVKVQAEDKAAGKGEDWSMPFTAHPKLDSATGNLHFLGYNIDKKPWLKYGVLSPAGQVAHALEVDLPYPTMLHDMAITENYAIFMHLPLVFEPEAMIKQNSLPLVFKPELPARIGLLPKFAKSADEMKWFELRPAFMAFHIANAWEEPGGIVKLYACQMQEFDMAAEEFREELGSRLTEYTMDLNTGLATSRTICPLYGDFPIIHPVKNGVRNDYTYMATINPADKKARTNGVAKVKLAGSKPGEDATVAHILYGDGCYGGEAVFAPRYEDPALCKGEDDGFLLVYVYVEAQDASFFRVYDAATMAQQPVAEVRLPQRVPFGFHGAFIRQQQLQQQVW